MLLILARTTGPRALELGWQPGDNVSKGREARCLGWLIEWRSAMAVLFVVGIWVIYFWLARKWMTSRRVVEKRSSV